MRFRYEPPWKRRLPTGEELRREAERLGVHFDSSSQGGDAELQQRVLVALVERRNAFVNYIQTSAIVATLILTILIAVWSERRQETKESADVMFKFNEILTSGKSAIVTKALDLSGNLNNAADVDDDALEQFLDDYELLAAAYRHGLIDRDMAYDEFSYDLDKALHDKKIQKFLIASRREEGDFYDGVFELARDWKIDTSAITQAVRAQAIGHK